MGSYGTALAFDLLARDGASPAFLKVAAAADKTAAATARAQKGVAGLQASAARTGAALTKSLTLPILGIAAVAAKAAADYQKHLNVIAVATDQTSKQIQATGRGLLKVSDATATSVNSLTDALYTVEKGGLRGAAALATVKAAAQGAKAEGADLGTVAQGLTSIMASYGSSLRNPVAAMDLLVRGSGLAKTSLQDFVGSLSSVVPLAASLKIPLSQITGALDTLTQHGETAQRGAENLNNLITNLASPNQVAAGALGQLGVSTLKLSRVLGNGKQSGGLSGALNYVFTAIAHHSKDGQVVVDTFRKSALASASLRTELAAMPPALRKQAEAFNSGKLGYQEFYKYVKSLGGQQFALGKNFIATSNVAKGFNKQLTSGNGNVRTLAGTLKNALGGVTGMRLALMLSGSSAKQFAEYTAAGALAARHAGKDVLGFAQTQQTAAYKADAAFNSLRNNGIRLGQALLPVVGDLASGLSHLIGWFNGLSGTSKKLLGWSAVALAAMGPVLSLFAKLVTFGRATAVALGFKRFTVAAQTSGVRVAAAARTEAAAVEAANARMVESARATTLAVEANATAQASAMRYGGYRIAGSRAGAVAPAAAASAAPVGVLPGAAAASRPGFRAVAGQRLAGAAGIFVIGQVAGSAIDDGKAGSVRNQASTVLVDAAAGAAIGSVIAPGIGTAIGAGFGTIAGLLSGQKPTSVASSDRFTALTQAQNRQNGPAGQFAAKVQGFFVGKGAGKTIAATRALQAFTQAQEASGKAVDATALAIAQQAVKLDGIDTAAAKAGLTQKDLTNAVLGTKDQYLRAKQALVDSGKVAPAVIRELDLLRQAHDKAGTAAGQDAVQHGYSLASWLKSGTVAQFLTGKIVNLNTAHQTAKRRAMDFAAAEQGVTAAVAVNGATLDRQTSFGQKNVITIRKAAEAAVAHGQAVYQANVNLKGVPAATKLAEQAYGRDRKALIDNATAAGLNRTQVKQLLTTLGFVKPHYKGKVSIDTKQALADTQTLTGKLRNLYSLLGVKQSGPQSVPGKAKRGAVLPSPVLIGAPGMAGRYPTAADSLAASDVAKYTKLKAPVIHIKADPSDALATVRHVQGAIDRIKQSRNPAINADSRPGQAAIAHLQSILDGIKQKVPPSVIVQGESAEQTLIRIQNYLNGLHDRQIQVRIAQSMVNTGMTGRNPGQLHPYTGGLITGPGTGTSDSIPAMLSNGEYVINARQTRKHMRLLSAINRGAQGFASGGLAHNGTAVSSAIDAVGQGYTPRFNITDTSYSRVMAQIHHAYQVLAQQFGNSAAAGFRRQLAGLVHLANTELGKLRVKIKGSDLAALRNSLRGTADTARAAVQQTIADVRAAGASPAVLRALGAAGGRLVSGQGTLAAARDYQSGIASTLRGGFDASKFGSVTDLLNGLSGASASNRAYGTELNTLRAKARGNKTLLAFINEQAAQGNTTTLQSLAGASGAQLAQVSKGLSAYNSSVSFGSEAATTTKFGKSVAQLTDSQNLLAHAVASLAAAVGGAVKHGHGHRESQAQLEAALHHLDQALSNRAGL